MRAPLILLAILFGSSSALALPAAHPDAACQTADATADGVLASTWYEACAQQTRLGSTPTLRYTQTLLSCNGSGSSCSYLPTFHSALSTLGAGDWTLRATSLERAYPSHAIIPGSQRALPCDVVHGATSCAAQVDNQAVTGSNFQSARWEGSWTLWLREPTGERLMSTGTASGWLAQYCACES